VILGSATFDGNHRLQLDRWWNDNPRALVCMSNPSTAGADVNDATIHSLCRLLRHLPGCGGFTVVNAETYIATSPAKLSEYLRDEYPVLIKHARDVNLKRIERLARIAFVKIVAWGDLQPWSPHTARVERALGLPLMAFGFTKKGNPKHPLARGRSFIATGTKPIVWKGNT
jgi:hypothetical protein